MSAAPPTCTRPRVVLAFPATRGGPDPLFTALHAHWEAAGLLVEHLPLDPHAVDAVLEQQLTEAASGPVIIGGFSLGARIAANITPTVGPLGLLCLGFPFHRRADPQGRHGLAALHAVRVPTLIVQGSRDPHGDRPQVHSYGALPSCVRVHWLDDGNHRLRPRIRSGHTVDGHLWDAAEASIDFLTNTMRETVR